MKKKWSMKIPRGGFKTGLKLSLDLTDGRLIRMLQENQPLGIGISSEPEQPMLKPIQIWNCTGCTIFTEDFQENSGKL